MVIDIDEHGAADPMLDQQGKQDAGQARLAGDDDVRPACRDEGHGLLQKIVHRGGREGAEGKRRIAQRRPDILAIAVELRPDQFHIIIFAQHVGDQEGSPDGVMPDLPGDDDGLRAPVRLVIGCMQVGCRFDTLFRYRRGNHRQRDVVQRGLFPVGVELDAELIEAIGIEPVELRRGLQDDALGRGLLPDGKFVDEPQFRMRVSRFGRQHRHPFHRVSGADILAQFDMQIDLIAVIGRRDLPDVDRLTQPYALHLNRPCERHFAFRGEDDHPIRRARPCRDAPAANLRTMLQRTGFRLACRADLSDDPAIAEIGFLCRAYLLEHRHRIIPPNEFEGYS
ncbi:hypothetical protein SAMN05518866_12545 [Sphingobium sp. YR768]|nr:hypothetical protein SAMN05518866_12545 [Sphingobium sp. YR768]